MGEVLAPSLRMKFFFWLTKVAPQYHPLNLSRCLQRNWTITLNFVPGEGSEITHTTLSSNCYMSEEGFPIVSVGVALHSQRAAAQISGVEADLGYSFFFLSSCRLFLIHNRLKGAVLFIIPQTWLCYSLFLIFQTEIFFIHFLFNPAINESLFGFHPRTNRGKLRCEDSNLLISLGYMFEKTVSPWGTCRWCWNWSYSLHALSWAEKCVDEMSSFDD